MALTNIGLFGRRNVGKSSLVNLLSGQEISIVSSVPGTTTDAVRKRIELPDMGKCLLIDTAGIDDSGDLGTMRVEKSAAIARQVDIALILFANNIFGREERELLEFFRDEDTPVILVHNQSDLVPLDPAVAVELAETYHIDVVEFSCKNTDIQGRESAVELLLAYLYKAYLQVAPYQQKGMFEGLDYSRVLLVCPIDSEAPEGRLILPQAMAIRELLDKRAIVSVVQPDTLKQYLETSPLPELVVTDSQAFSEVAAVVPASVPLTSFSVLMARKSSCYKHYLEGTPKISNLQDGDRILILESCTHHSSCEDIGRVKLPALFRKFTGKSLEFDVVAGLDKIERNISEYSMVVQCGGCMITSKQLHMRLKPAIKAGIPVANYGMAIAYMKGVKLSADGIR
jgi:[FeFe] hydrogenase H-cluster maturation GTPase HydF